MIEGDSTAHEAEQELMRRRLDGTLVPAKMRIIFDMHAVDWLNDQLLDPTVSFGSKMDIIKLIARLGDLEPNKNVIPIQAHEKFNLTINVQPPALGGVGSAGQQMVNVTPAPVPPTLTLNLAPTGEAAPTADRLEPDPAPPIQADAIEHDPLPRVRPVSGCQTSSWRKTSSAHPLPTGETK